MSSSDAVNFSLLPEAESYPHPGLSWLVELGFDLTVFSLYRVEKMLEPGCRPTPGALIISNHQRESDVPIVCATLCRRKGLRIFEPLPFFAMREDLLDRRALANLLAKWPRPIAKTLGKIPLRWLFESVRTMPMRRLREFMLGDLIEALIEAGLGDAAPDAVLNARGQREVVAQMQILPEHLRDITREGMGPAWRTYWGLRRARLSALRKIESDFRATVDTQLGSFAALLDRGHAVYMAPEGTISPTGRFGRVRAGPWRVSRRRATPALILPLAVSYDALGPGRLRVVVHGAAPMRNPDLSDQCRFGDMLRKTLLRLCVLTPSHLLAWWVCHGPERFAETDLVRWLERGRDAAHHAGIGLDPLWLRISGAALAKERLQWMRRKRLLERGADGTWSNIWPRDTNPGWATPAATVPYFVNLLMDFAPEFAQALHL